MPIVPPPDNNVAPEWRTGDCPRTRAIELSPVVVLHDGLKSGGTLYRKGLRFPGASVEKTFSRKNRAKRAELEVQFDQVVDNCTLTQKQTRNLFYSLKERDIKMSKELKDVSNRLQVMRSMPDLTISPDDFDEFLKNALAQPKLEPNPLESEAGGRSTKVSNLNLVAPNVKPGSMQHIFPTRDWAKGGVIKNKRGK